MNVYHIIFAYLLVLALLGGYAMTNKPDCWEPDFKTHKICYIGGFMGWCKR